MIPIEVIRRIKLSTCSVIYMPIKHEVALSAKTQGDNEVPYETIVIATGYLVRDNLLLTNRHVIEQIFEDGRKKGTRDHWYIGFTHSDKLNNYKESVIRIKDI